MGPLVADVESASRWWLAASMSASGILSVGGGKKMTGEPIPLEYAGAPERERAPIRRVGVARHDHRRGDRHRQLGRRFHFSERRSGAGGAGEDAVPILRARNAGARAPYTARS